MTTTDNPAEELFAALEERTEHALGATDPDPRSEGERLAALERDLQETVAELTDLETDLADDRGHPVLADTSAWRELAERTGAPAGARDADALAQRIIADHAAAWLRATEEHLDRDDTRGCFRALAEARALDVEALTRTLGGPPLRDARPLLRDRFLLAARDHPVDIAVRDAWVRELLDRADVVLTSLEYVEPDRAWELIDLVTNDLEWHLTMVEMQRSWRRTRLRRRIRRLRAEQQERDLQSRLEKRWGARNVARFERLIFLLIGLVLALLTIETFTDPSDATVMWFAVIDFVACLVFLWEIAVKLWLVQGKWRWFYRHFFVDILPSIPFSVLLLRPGAWDSVRLFRVLRIIRLGRFARYARFLRPVLRIVRAFGFLGRGIDRMVRKYGHLLNRSIVLYPTREERQRFERERAGIGPRLRRLQARLNDRWATLLSDAPAADREAIVEARVATLEQVRESGVLQRHRPVEDTTSQAEREIAADAVLDRLARISPEEVEAGMGSDFVARAARAARIFSLPPIRWLPVIRRYVPRLAKGMTDQRVVAETSRRMAIEFARVHDRWLWFADLYGTITPAQFVDRVGTAMAKAAFRPAYRLTLFGMAYLVLMGFLELLHIRHEGIPVLEQIVNFLERIVGTVLVALGAVCFAVLGTGWWLRSIAGQATEFFARSAQAQYLALTESIKGRSLERDAGIIDRRVLAPERLLRGKSDGSGARSAFVRSVRQWLLEAQPGESGAEGFDLIERAVLIYRDGLDGALFVSSDTRTTAQLLGNLALRNLRAMSERFTEKEDRELRRLDLDRKKTFGGPYLWFSLICQAVAHGVARLLVDYNRHALPLSQVKNASPEERQRYEAWLGAAQVADLPSEQVMYVTTYFMALHFLDDDAQRDEEVKRRFGLAVTERLQRDRRLLFRRIFGTYPVHKLPRDDRVLNLYRLYQRWFAGGRAFAIPFLAARTGWGYTRRSLAWLKTCVKEVKRPSFVVDMEAAEGADFHSALRKIDRMRMPVAEAALRQRIRFDPEYLGIRLPDADASGLENCNVGDDLRFLDASPELTREVEIERDRATRDMVRFGRLLEDGLQERLSQNRGTTTREQVRAAAVAYYADLNGVRRLLSATEILEEVFGRAARGDLLPRSAFVRPRLYTLFWRYWKANGNGDSEARRAAWRATAHNVDGVADALVVFSKTSAGCRLEGERALTELLRHPERITEQIVTLRAVQTLSLIDVLNYRRHVYRLGRYAESGDRPGDSLELR